MQEIDEKGKDNVDRKFTAHPESPLNAATAEDEIRTMDVDENLLRSTRDASLDELFPIE